MLHVDAVEQDLPVLRGAYTCPGTWREPGAGGLLLPGPQRLAYYPLCHERAWRWYWPLPAQSPGVLLPLLTQYGFQPHALKLPRGRCTPVDGSWLKMSAVEQNLPRALSGLRLPERRPVEVCLPGRLLCRMQSLHKYRR